MSPNWSLEKEERKGLPRGEGMEESVQKIFIYGKSEVAVICQACGKVRRLQASDIEQINHIVRVQCVCGARFNVLFEKRIHYRKVTHLEGRYAIKLDPDECLCLLVVENLSRNGIGFKTIGNYDIKEGDVLSVQFSLDNEKRTMIKSNITVKSVNGKYIGGEFHALDEHAKKELGFYLLP